MNDARRRQAIALYDRFTHEGMDRRSFMTKLTRIAGSGAAANALLIAISTDPAAAALIPADDKRLRAQEIEWEVAGGRKMKGYQATLLPLAERPLVLVIHENRGLNDYIRDVARRAALAGYTALAPDFLSAAGGTPADQDEARTMIGKLDLAQTAADAIATIDRFHDSKGAKRRRIGAVGFCWGGAMVNRLAVAAGSKLDAGVVFYGPAPSPTEAGRVETPLLIHLAEKDERVNATALPWVVALRNSGKSVRAINYPSANHAFHNDTSAERYDAGAASRAWATTLHFFKRHLS